MATKRESAVSKHLVWVFLQGFVFLPAALGPFSWDELRQASWLYWGLSLFVLAWVAYCLVRNLVRMWKAPASEASKWHVAPLFAVGGLFALVSSGPLVEGSRDTKPMGVAILLVALAVLGLAFREVVRLRQRSAEAAAA